MGKLLPVIALALAGCTTLPPELPQARLLLIKPMSLCVFNCRIVIEQQNAHSEGGGAISETGGAVSETDSHSREARK